MAKKILLFCLGVFVAFPVASFAEESNYDLIPIKAGEPAPFDGILISLDAAAKMAVDKKFEDTECDLRLSYELSIIEEKYKLQLDYKDIEIASWKDRYESMMILKSAENDRLYNLVTKTKPGREPFMVALGFGMGTLTSLGIFALSTEIVKQ